MLDQPLPPAAMASLRPMVRGPMRVLRGAHVGPVLTATLHGYVNLVQRVGELVRAHPGAEEPDLKGLAAIRHRSSLRDDLGKELGHAEGAARRTWSGATASHTRGRDLFDQEENPRGDSLGR